MVRLERERMLAQVKIQEVEISRKCPGCERFRSVPRISAQGTKKGERTWAGSLSAPGLVTIIAEIVKKVQTVPPASVWLL